MTAEGDESPAAVISVSPDGYDATADLLPDPVGELRGLQMLVGAEELKVIVLGPDLWLWVSDDKFGLPGPVNVVVPRVCRFPGATRPTEDIHGTVVFTGPRNDQEQLTSLSTHWSNVIKIRSIEARAAGRR